MKKNERKTEGNQFSATNFGHKKKIQFILFVFSFLIGINTLNHSFTVDDEIYYSGNKISQKGIAGIKEMFTRGSTSGFKETGKKDLYRPIVMLSFGLEKDLFNNNPRAFSFYTNHTVCMCLCNLVCIAEYFLFILSFPDSIAYCFIVCVTPRTHRSNYKY